MTHAHGLRVSLASVGALLLVASGCGGGGGGGGGGPHGGCGTAACGSVANACGSVLDACGDVVSCGACRFTGESIDTQFAEDIALAAGDPTAVAYGGTVATRDAGTWSPSTFGSQTGLRSLGIAYGSDGTPWVLFRDQSGAFGVAHFDGSTWIAEALPDPTIGTDGAIAVASDGTPTVVYSGIVSGMGAVVLARRVSDAWTTTSVAMPSGPFVDAAIAMVGDETEIVWYDGTEGVMFAHGHGAGPFTPEVVDAAAGGTSPTGLTIYRTAHVLDMAVDGAGVVHLAYKDGSNDLVHAMRTDGTWTHEAIPRLSTFSHYVESDGPLHIAVSPSGDVAVGILGEELTVLSLEQGTWFEQPVAAHCNSNGAFDMGFDASGTLAIAHTCRSGQHYMRMSGSYPSDYGATCQQIIDGWCSQACTCPRDVTGKCCVLGSSSLCVDAPPLCLKEFVESPCADATLDASTIYGCRDAVMGTAPVCTAPGAADPGLMIPSACSMLF